MNFNIIEKNGTKTIIYISPLSFSLKNKSLEWIIGNTRSDSKKVVLGDIIAENINSNIIKVMERNSGKLLTFIFKSPIKVIYKQLKDKETLIDESVYSLCQIDDLLNYYKIKNPYFRNKENNLLNYFESKIFLNLNEDDKELIIVNGDKKYILEKNNIILTDDNFDKLLLSKYFDKYFIYPDKDTNFRIFTSENRKKCYLI